MCLRKQNPFHTKHEEFLLFICNLLLCFSLFFLVLYFCCIKFTMVSSEDYPRCKTRIRVKCVELLIPSSEFVWRILKPLAFHSIYLIETIFMIRIGHSSCQRYIPSDKRSGLMVIYKLNFEFENIVSATCVTLLFYVVNLRYIGSTKWLPCFHQPT